MSDLDENLVSKPSSDLLNDVVATEGAKADDKANEEKKSKKDKKSPKEKGEKKKRNIKKLKHSAMATGLTVAFLVVLVLVNIVATKLFERYPITIDLTSDNIYSLSEDSEEYIKSIDVDVIITVFAEESDFSSISTYTQQANEVLKRYSQYNDKIQVKYVDIESNPDILRDYTDDISAYDIMVETNPTDDDGNVIKRTRLLTLLDLVQFNDEFTENLSNYGMTAEELASQAGGALSLLNYYGNYVESSNAEQAFTSGIMTVTDPNPITVTMLTGREELTELSYFQTLLVANGYTVNTIDITTEEIPEDTDIIVMAAPKVDYLADDIAKVDTFLKNDGNLQKQLIYVASTAQEDTPNIDEFLAEYGLEIGEGVVCETYSGNYYQKPYYTIASTISDNFLQDMSIDNPALLVLSSRPVNSLFEEKGMLITTPYVQSTENAYTQSITDSTTLTKGTQSYITVASKAAFAGDDTLYSNIIAIGSPEILGDEVLAYNQYQNREYILSVINGICHKTDGITITPKVISGNIFDITDSQKNRLKWTFIAIIPAIVLITCLVVWIRRKNR